MHGFMFAGILLLLFRYVVKQNVSTGWRLVIALAAEAAWEILENTNAVIDRYRETTAFLGYRGDTVVNSIGDILCCGVGVLIARKLGWLRSLPIFLATEIVLLFWIRDSLLLEMLMLVYPIDGLSTGNLVIERMGRSGDRGDRERGDRGQGTGRHEDMGTGREGDREKRGN